MEEHFSLKELSYGKLRELCSKYHYVKIVKKDGHYVITAVRRDN